MNKKYPLKKEDCTIELFMGAEYNIDAATIGELRGYLEQILKDLPTVDSLEIAEIHCKGTKISYLLKDGIHQ